MSNPILETFRMQDAVIQGLSAAIVRVRELHSPANPEDPEGWWVCAECVEGDAGEFANYPCSTIKALEANNK